MAAYLTQRCWKSWETTQEWEPRFFQDLGERWGSVVGDSVSAYVKELDDRYVLPTYRRQPLEIVGAEGTEVVGSDGRRYLDFVNGQSVSTFGYCHPAVVRRCGSRWEG